MADPIREVLSYLNEISVSLWAGINDDSRADEVRNALNLEYIEVQHRIQILLGKALTQQVAKLRELASGVRAATGELQQALKNIQSAAKVVSNVTKFLGGVDKFIDAAKKYFV